MSSEVPRGAGAAKFSSATRPLPAEVWQRAEIRGVSRQEPYIKQWDDNAKSEAEFQPGGRQR